MIILDNNNNSEHKPLVATIGFFDGVHAGHRFLIEQVKAEANKLDLPAAVITFPVHPRKVLNKDYQPALLCGYKEKIERLSGMGLDYCVALEFTKEISQMSAKEFMSEILKNELNVHTLFIGYDHRFGHNRLEDFSDYERYGKEIGINVIQAKELDPKEHVSSSRIRHLLAEGNIEKAAQLLTYKYTISGKIVEGFKVGRTIGFPTANIQIWEDFKVVPAFGVYAVNVYIKEGKYGGMLYIGKRPTLHNGNNVSLEVNILDFDGDLYNQSLTVELLEFVRPDEKFVGLDELKKQIFKDKETVQNILKKY